MSNDPPDLPDEIDPVLVERLMAWFGDGPPIGEETSREDPEMAEMRRVRERACAAAEPWLLERIENHLLRADDPLTLPPPPPSMIDLSLPKFDLARWGLRSVGEMREVEPPDELYDALRCCTPQALLRDLHRPVFHFRLQMVPVPVAGILSNDAHDQVRQLMRDSYSAGAQPTSSSIAAQELADLKHLLSQPWEDSKVVPTSERETQSALVEDFKWFGSHGFDPDL